MKRLNKVAAIILAAIMVLTMTATAFAVAYIDEDGNITQENEILPGGIMTLSGDLDLGFDMGADWEFGFGEDVFFPAFGNATGEVVEFWENDFTGAKFIRIRTVHVHEEEGEIAGYVDFSTNINTFFVGDEPEIGDTITGFFDNMRPMIMIYPPQHNALAIANITDDAPRLLLARFDENWVSCNGQFRLNISEDTEILFQGGDSFEGEIDELIGRKLLVEFMISHRDIPETIPNPRKITILYELAVHPILEIDWDVVDGEELPVENIILGDNSVLVAVDPWQNIGWSGYTLAQGQNVDWSEFEIIITINGLSRGVPNARIMSLVDGNVIYGVAEDLNHLSGGFSIYVPLRAVTEMLGFTPEWNAERRVVTVNSPSGEISINMNYTNYTLVNHGGVEVHIALSRPLMLGDRTYVPLQFFRELYGFNNAWWEGGQVYLDNAERME